MLLVFLIVSAAVFLREWPGIGKERAKERAVFLLLLVLAVSLAAFLRMYPRAPGPTDLVEVLFHPLADLFGL